VSWKAQQAASTWRSRSDGGLQAFAEAGAMPVPASRRRVGDRAPKRCECCGAAIIVQDTTWWCSASVGHPTGSRMPERARGSLWARDGVAWGALHEKLPGRAEPAFKARS
jgi:hypothetical protein